jgi:hypothetical protein
MMALHLRWAPAARVTSTRAVPLRVGTLLVTLAACQSHGATGDGIGSPVAQTSANRSGEIIPAPVPPVGPALEIVAIAPGRFALKSASGVSVAVQARMERRTAEGTWEAATPFELRQDCESPASAGCRQISAGGTFVPLSWSGDCGSCCTDESTRPLDPGPRRLVVSGCGNGALSWAGGPFDVPGTLQALERRRAAAAIESATAAQLNKAETSADAAPAQARIANIPVVRGTEAALAPDTIEALSAWLRDPRGFNDRVLKRCQRGNAFGFRMTRDTPHVGKEKTEIAIDLRCNSIAVINEEGSRTRRTDAFFDGSRAAALALLEQALPSVSVRSR